MSRTKKSRNPGVGSNGPVKVDKKLDRKLLEQSPDKKPKNKKGKKPGNRQQEAMVEPKKNQSSAAKDPRIGSKKPIDLGVAAKLAPVKKAKPKKQQPIAPIRTIEAPAASDSLEQELYAIEQDPRLLAILEKQDDDINLNEAEISLFNELMERHEEISVQLGLDQDEDEASESAPASNESEDDLWDKLDNNDLSKF